VTVFDAAVDGDTPFIVSELMTIDDALMEIDALMAQRLKPRVMAAR
jgi:hypothetical protein